MAQKHLRMSYSLVMAISLDWRFRELRRPAAIIRNYHQNSDSKAAEPTHFGGQLRRVETTQWRAKSARPLSENCAGDNRNRFKAPGTAVRLSIDPYHDGKISRNREMWHFLKLRPYYYPHRQWAFDDRTSRNVKIIIKRHRRASNETVSREIGRIFCSNSRNGASSGGERVTKELLLNRGAQYHRIEAEAVYRL
jgi:hypothetical protein